MRPLEHGRTARDFDQEGGEGWGSALRKRGGRHLKEDSSSFFFFEAFSDALLPWQAGLLSAEPLVGFPKRQV